MKNKYIEVNDDDQIFHILDPYANTKLSTLHGLDLQQIVFLIDQYYLIYRKKLGFDKKITFGFEIEVEHANWDDIYESICNLELNDWDLTGDASLDQGAEIKSPVLHDKKALWDDLNRICEMLSDKARVGKTTGSHIHVGTQILGSNRQNWLNLLKIWSVYENVIYRFLYGEYLTGRPGIKSYAQPVSAKFDVLYQRFVDENKKMKKIIHLLNTNIERYSAVNFENVVKKSLNDYKENNTIEFRVANGTINPIIWQNNLNMIINMLLYTKDTKFDLDTIDRRRSEIKEHGFNKYLFYDEVFLDQALEFCDLIFDNNYDKVYFLKQYLKSFEIENKRTNYSKAKELTKK